MGGTGHTTRHSRFQIKPTEEDKAVHFAEKEEKVEPEKQVDPAKEEQKNDEALEETKEELTNA